MHYFSKIRIETNHQQNCMPSNEFCIPSKEPYLSSQELYMSSNEPSMPGNLVAGGGIVDQQEYASVIHFFIRLMLWSHEGDFFYRFKSPSPDALTTYFTSTVAVCEEDKKLPEDT